MGEKILIMINLINFLAKYLMKEKKNVAAESDLDTASQLVNKNQEKN